MAGLQFADLAVSSDRVPGLHAAPGGDPHANQEATGRGADTGAATGQSGAAPPPVTDRARQQQCEALSHRERPASLVEAGRPRSRDGTLLCPAQLPGALGPVAADGLIGINSHIEGCR